MEESHSRRRFAAAVGRPDEAVDLAEASLLIACEEYPDLDVARYLARLDELGASLRERLAAGAAPAEGVAALNGLLFGEQGFRGNQADYYDPRNSFLNDVLDRRTGIPITLSAVYMEVGRRAGLRIAGIGLPGHFIVRVGGEGVELLVDPYHGGVRLSARDCQERLDRIYGGRVRLGPGLLVPCGPRAMLTRMLRNLKVIYLKLGDHERALGAIELLLRVDPRSAEDVRDRGLVYAALDCYKLAIEDLERHLALAPEAPDGPALMARITELRGKATRLN